MSPLVQQQMLYAWDIVERFANKKKREERSRNGQEREKERETRKKEKILNEPLTLQVEDARSLAGLH